MEESTTTERKCLHNSDKVCYHYPCDYIDLQGNVLLCKHHKNPIGRMIPKKASSEVF